MQVIKRDGRLVDFDKSKIITAILKAFYDIDKEKTEDSITIANKIADEISNIQKDIDVEKIQNLVEKKLMSSARKDVAKAYIIYRNDRNKTRYKNSDFMKRISEKLFATNVENQNANVDEKSFGGRMGAANSELLKNYALNYIVSPMSRENHLNNEIYIHDLDSYAVGLHNCLTIPFDDLLANGFNTRQTDVRPANSINTAFQLLAVIFQLQSLQQFGGVSASHLDWTMVPYVRKSFWKHFKVGLKYVELNRDDLLSNDEELIYEILNDDWAQKSIEDNSYKYFEMSYDYAMDMTEKELKQSVEGMYHNLNTLQSRSGNQLPFTSINYGTCTLAEGRMVTKALLEGSIEGVGKLHKTPVFPCSIFQCMNGVNRHKGEPNYDLFQLALKSTAQRLYPNYANVDWSGNEGYDKNDPRTYFSTMGQRKFYSPYKILMNLISRV